MAGIGPSISSALFCERIEKNEQGIDSFINLIDTITYTPAGSEKLITWAGKLEVGIVFGDDRAGVKLEIFQIEDATGERKKALTQEFDPSDFPGKLTLSYKLDFKATYESVGRYWYEFYLDGELKTRAPLQVELVSDQSP